MVLFVLQTRLEGEEDIPRKAEAPGPVYVGGKLRQAYRKKTQIPWSYPSDRLSAPITLVSRCRLEMVSIWLL